MCWFLKASNPLMFSPNNYFKFFPIRIDVFPFSSIYDPPYPTFQSHRVLLPSKNTWRRRTYRPKRCGNNNKDEDNSPKTLNDKNNHYSLIRVSVTIYFCKQMIFNNSFNILLWYHPCFRYTMDSSNKDIIDDSNSISKLVAKAHWRHSVTCFLWYIIFILLSKYMLVLFILWPFPRTYIYIYIYTTANVKMLKSIRRFNTGTFQKKILHS